MHNGTFYDCKTCANCNTPVVCHGCSYDAPRNRGTKWAEIAGPSPTYAIPANGGLSLKVGANGVIVGIKATDIKVDDPARTGPLGEQVGGGHYKHLKFQPYEIAHGNKLDGLQMNVLKYTMRFREKNGEADLDKAIHTLQVLKALEYPKP